MRLKRLWLLTRIEYASYEEFDSKVVRASTSNEAREIANLNPGDEGKIWTDPKEVLCEILKTTGKSEVIIGSFNAG